MQFRQGDVFLNECNHDQLPDLEDKKYNSINGSIEKNSIVLAYGEVTGHKHAIYEMDKVFLMKAKNDNRYFLIVLKETELKHEEHNTIKLPVGNYEVIKQREYTPDSIRWVAD